VRGAEGEGFISRLLVRLALGLELVKRGGERARQHELVLL
jgi:hypothetical protein